MGRTSDRVPARGAPGRFVSARPRAHGRRALRLALVVVAALVVVGVAGLALSYDGRCGGYFPGLSAPRPCSRWAYLTGDGLAIVLVLSVSYWPLLLVLAFLPVIGYWLDRRR